MKRLFFVLTLLACNHGRDVAPKNTPPPTPLASSPAPTATPTEAPIADTKPLCRVAKTTELSRRPYGSLANLRVAADVHGAVVTWHALDMPEMGDSSQVAEAVFLKRGEGDDSDTPIVLPARAYAAAAYTQVVATKIGEELDLLTYGVAGATSFVAFKDGPKPWKKNTDPFLAAPPSSWYRDVHLKFSFEEALVAAQTMPLAVLGGAEAPCAGWYVCPTFEAAQGKGLPKSVRSLFLPPKGHVSEVLYKGTAKLPEKPFVPTVAGAPDGERAFAMFRVDKALHGVWFDKNGKMGASFVVWEGTQVGAPAVAFVGGTPHAVWVARTTAQEPYKLYVARIGADKTELVREVDTGGANTMAPAIAEANGAIVVAYMVGDNGTKGRVFLHTLAAPLAAGTEPLVLSAPVTTSEEGNHRDPELASAAGRLYLVWSNFTKKKGVGTPMLQELTCP